MRAPELVFEWGPHLGEERSLESSGSSQLGSEDSIDEL